MVVISNATLIGALVLSFVLAFALGVCATCYVLCTHYMDLNALVAKWYKKKGLDPAVVRNFYRDTIDEVCDTVTDVYNEED